MNRLLTIRKFSNNFCLVKKGFLTQDNGLISNSAVKRGKPETFLGDLQEVLKLAPDNINAYFYSWSIACRFGTVFLCLLLI